MNTMKKLEKMLKKRMREEVMRSGGRNSNDLLAPSSSQFLNRLKFEVADELGLTDRISDVGYANMTSRECGSIGGFMVRRMINYAETHMPNVLEDHGKVTDLVPGEEFFFPDEDDE